MKHYNPTIEGEITLSAFSNTRNDGVIPTNKILSTDTNGNLKLYSIATAPAPFLDYVVPYSTLPSTTGNFQLHGSFFTPSMCLTANLATSIIFTGQTVNYAIFHNSQWIEVNITTGATEGSFAITLNNGLSATFVNAILISWGTIFTPSPSDWNTIVEPIDLSENGSAKVETWNSQGSAIWNKNISFALNFRIITYIKKSPLGTAWANNFGKIDLLSVHKTSDNSMVFRLYIWTGSSDGHIGWSSALNTANHIIQYFTGAGDISSLETKPIDFRWTDNVLYLYVNNALINTFTDVLTENCYVKASPRTVDVSGLKYIEIT